MVAAHMVRVSNMLVEKTANITIQDFFRHATVW